MAAPSDDPRAAKRDTVRRHIVARGGGALVVSVGVHAFVATTLLVAPRLREASVRPTSALDLVAFEATEPEPPPEPEATVRGAPDDRPALRETVTNSERGLRVAATRPAPRLSLTHFGEPRGPFDFVDRLDVGRYTPRIATHPSRVDGSERPAVEAESTEPPLEEGAEPVIAPEVTAETETPETTPDPTVTVPAGEGPIALEPAPSPTADTEAATSAPAIDASRVVVVATGRADLVALRGLGDAPSTLRALSGLGVEPLPLLGLEPGDVTASADVRGGDLLRGRALALATVLDAAALRQRIEGAAIARGAAPVFGDAPLPSTAELVVDGQAYTLTLDGSRLVLATRRSARLLRAGLSALSSPDDAPDDTIAAAERVAPETTEGPVPVRLTATLHGNAADPLSIALRLAFEFGSEAEAEAARTLGFAYVDVARRAFGLPDAAVDIAAEPELDGARLVFETTPGRMGPAELAARLARAD